MVHQNRPLSTLLLYALPAIGLAALTLPLYVVVPTFYAESLGLSVQSIGLALLAVRLFDAVNDPVFGWLSDRWQPTFGRRRLWFIVFVPVAIWGAFKLFWPPSGVDVSYLFLWSLVLSIGYTGAILPYTAWGAELETTYSGRSRISSMREGFVLVGTLLAISVPFTVGWTDPNSVHGLAYLAIGIVAFLSISAAIAVWCVPEPQDYSNERLSLIDGLKPILRNLPFKRLVLASFLNGMGNAIAATLFLLYCSERLALEEWRGPFLFLYFFAGIAGIPIWLSLANKASKHQAWCIAMVCAVLVFSPAPFLPAGLVWPFLIVCLLSGLTLGADLALPAAMQADVIDIDTAEAVWKLCFIV